jgi:hypothetical protein
VTSMSRLASAIIADPQPGIRYLNTTVAGVSVGTGLDGNDEVSITINSDTPTVPYLDGYVNGHTPTVGDAVAVAIFDGSPIILGRIFGLPNI